MKSNRHAHADRGLDLYETPTAAVQALMRAEKIPHCVWEPAAGRGAIARALRKAGHTVIASDVVHHGGFRNHFLADFLKQTKMPAKSRAIVTNPPFMFAEPFIAHALDVSPRTIMLLRLAFLESERRRVILENCGLARVHVFRNRLPMMHRDQWNGRKASSSTAFAWFVWDRAHSGPTELRRISWEAAE